MSTEMSAYVTNVISNPHAEVTHEEVSVELDTEQFSCQVDQELKNIIEYLNANGFNTVKSCQDFNDSVIITFTSYEVVNRLLEVCLQFHKDHHLLYNGETLWNFLNSPDKRRWSLGEVNEVPDLDLRFELSDEEFFFNHPTKLEIQVTLLFKREHLRYFETLLYREFVYSPKKQDLDLAVRNKYDVGTLLRKLFSNASGITCNDLSGLSNHLYQCRFSTPVYAEDDSDEEYPVAISFTPHEVLVKVREETEPWMQEISIVDFLSMGKHRPKIGPKVIGVFKNGYVSEFIPGKPLSRVDLDDCLILIAKKLATLHLTPFYAAKKNRLDPRLGRWIRSIDFAKVQKQAGEMAFSWKLTREFFERVQRRWEFFLIEKMKDPSFYGEVVLCHRDLTYKNIILQVTDEGERSIDFIDFEYAGYSFSHYDVANFFNEWAGDELDQDQLPTKEQKTTFVTAYLQARNQLTGQKKRTRSGEKSDDVKVSDYLKELEVFQDFSNFHWGIWALHQSQNQNNPIEFDYFSYGMKRLDQTIRIET